MAPHKENRLVIFLPANGSLTERLFPRQAQIGVIPNIALALPYMMPMTLISHAFYEEDLEMQIEMSINPQNPQK